MERDRSNNHSLIQSLKIYSRMWYVTLLKFRAKTSKDFYLRGIAKSYIYILVLVVFASIILGIASRAFCEFMCNHVGKYHDCSYDEYIAYVAFPGIIVALYNFVYWHKVEKFIYIDVNYYDSNTVDKDADYDI